MNVLLAIDDSPASAAAIDTVITEFQPEAARVLVLHVIAWPRELPACFMFGEGASAADRVLAAHDQLRRRAADLVAGAVRRLSTAHFIATAVVVDGDPRTEILAMAKRWPASTIVVGSHARGTMDRIVLGSVSRGVLRRARCSVLIARPAAGEGRAAWRSVS
jgi:nucleotide-binding universal stress UspA family protein